MSNNFSYDLAKGGDRVHLAMLGADLKLDSYIREFGVEKNGERYVLRGITTSELENGAIPLMKKQMQRMIASQADMVGIELLV